MRGAGLLVASIVEFDAEGARIDTLDTAQIDGDHFGALGLAFTWGVGHLFGTAIG